MAIEKLIEKLVASLDANTAAVQAHTLALQGAPVTAVQGNVTPPPVQASPAPSAPPVQQPPAAAPTAPVTAPPVTAAPALTAEQLNAALQAEAVRLNDRGATILAILKEWGHAGISNLPPARYNELLARVRAIGV